MRFLNNDMSSKIRNLYFVLASFFFVFIIDFIYIDWFRINPASIDPWLYWGTGEVFSYIKFHFSQTYYFRRWTINSVNYFFSGVFNPFLAIYFKNLFLLTINFLISILLIFRITKSFFFSLIFLFFFIPANYYLYSVGSNYSQATGIFFINLLVLSTFYFDIKYKYKYFFILGFIIFCALVTYQYLAYVIFCITFFWISINYKFFISLNIKNFFFIILSIFVGLISGSFFEYLISLLLNVKWENFFIFSFKYYLSIIKEGNYSAPKDFYYKIFGIYSFIIPAVFISLTLLRISLFIKNKNYLGFSCMLLCLTGYHLLDPLLGTNTTFFPQINIYLFVFCLFGLILLLDFIIKDYKILFKIFLVVFIFLLSLLIMNKINFTNNNLYVTILITILFLLIVFFLKKKLIKFLLILFFIILYVQLLHKPGYHDKKLTIFDKRDDFKNYINKVSLEIKGATKKAIDFDTSQPRRLWILDNRPHEGWSNTISSLYGNYSAINLGYKNNTVECKQIDWILMFPNSVLVIYGFDTESNSLIKLIDLFKPCGSFIFEKSIKIENAHTFTVKKIL